MSNTKLCVLGGDMRQLTLACYLSQKGYETALWGLPYTDSTDTVSAYCGDCNCVRCADPESALRGSRAAILPLPATTDGVRVSCNYANADSNNSCCELRLTRLMEWLPKGAPLLAGMPSDVMRTMARDENVKLIDYYNLEEIQIKNAVPTVEGAIAIAMKELPITLLGSECTVLGYGRIGKRLAYVLHALGANVTVCARSEKDLSSARIAGCKALRLSDYQMNPCVADILFNTVPTNILTIDMLEKMPQKMLIIELASAPGCMDARTQKQCRQKIIRAASLPGKISPITAGKILFESIEQILAQEGVLP